MTTVSIVALPSLPTPVFVISFFIDVITICTIAVPLPSTLRTSQRRVRLSLVVEVVGLSPTVSRIVVVWLTA
jgi:hypothetical protein